MSHFVLAVRPSTYLPYRIEGDDESRIECHHACARDAEEAIRNFCRDHHCTATVEIYTPRNHLWSTSEIAVDGSITTTRPEWLDHHRKAA